jgi:DNA-binding MarR family transcriptional regulator
LELLNLQYSILEDARIKPSEKLVLLALQRWGWKALECFPADDTIAAQAAIGRRTVQRSLDRLEKFGFIREVPDNTNPTGRKFLLLWLDDPKYTVADPVLPSMQNDGWCSP